MMITKQLSRYFLGAAMISVVSVACASGLRDYTQIELAVDIPEQSEEESAETVEPDTLAETQIILEQRLAGLAVDTAEVSAQEPNTVIVRLPLAASTEVGTEAIAAKLVQPAQLTLRSQKPETEEALSTGIETLQRLLVEQNNFQQTNKQAEADALQPQIDETRATILALFDPSEFTGDMLLDAQAVQISGFNAWEVNLWFDSQGTDKFAEQTKALAGTGRAIGIFLDDVLLSTSVVDIAYADTGITEGEMSIAGNFTAEAAADLERQLKIGALPAPLEIVGITSSDESDSSSEGSEAEESETEEREEDSE